ncbi:MAG: lasso RiPP family leader peptide-containing protein [Planctomycetota bacterium]|nr:lasso RiPP family leader peptide-containing protein [Planctomycetota bacterium]
MHANDDTAKQTPKQRKRRTYQAPKLTVYGAVNELTGGGADATVSDHGNDMMFTS